MAYTTVNDPQKHFNTVLYTGTLVANPVVGVGFQPDLVWVKDREGTNWHSVGDSSRGINKLIYPSEVDDEYTNSGNGQLITSFDSDGFTLGTHDNQNYASRGFVSWNWLANGGTTTTNDASATSIGDQDSVYQANTTSGFSIVTWSGSNGVNTMAHGLGAVPNLIIMKARVGTEAWGVYHHKNTSAPETDFLRLDTDAATSDSTTLMNDTAPTSTIFTVGDSGTANEVGKTYVSYQFAEKQGYSKFGGYTGNGNADGTFVYTGFKPAWLTIKRVGNAEAWFQLDTARDTFNPATKYFELNANTVEDAGADKDIDILSNGFKCRVASGFHNDAEDYVYMAFAEQPFVTSGGVPCTAR